MHQFVFVNDIKFKRRGFLENERLCLPVSNILSKRFRLLINIINNKTGFFFDIHFNRNLALHNIKLIGVDCLYPSVTLMVLYYNLFN